MTKRTKRWESKGAERKNRTGSNFTDIYRCELYNEVYVVKDTWGSTCFFLPRFIPIFCLDLVAS